MCVCLQDGPFWLILHLSYKQTWVKLGAIGSSRGNLAGSGEPGQRQA